MHKFLKFFFSRPLLLFLLAVISYCLTNWYIFEYSDLTIGLSEQAKAFLFILFTIAAVVYAILLCACFKIIEKLDKIIEKYKNS